MLSVNKLQSFNDKFIYKSANANSLIEPIVQIVMEQYKTHHFQKDFNLKIPNILVDVDKFQQVMINLIENAAKYSNEGTTITIKTDFCESPDYISIRVKDEGIGIKEEDFNKVFEKFSRLDNPLTRKAQGSGLGLYITKSIVCKMGGKINIIPQSIGTIFEILLPVANIEKQAEKIIKDS